MEDCLQQYLSILGHRVKDVITDFEGVADSVCFDLYGCVLVGVMPPINKDDPEKSKSRWLDHKRLTTLSATPVMAQPVFDRVAGKENGPAEHANR